jgi:hypothetical protein
MVTKITSLNNGLYNALEVLKDKLLKEKITGQKDFSFK